MKRSSCDAVSSVRLLLAVLSVVFIGLISSVDAKTFTGRAAERCNPNDLSEPVGSPNDWDHPKNWGTPCDPVPPPAGGDSAVIPAGFTVYASSVSVGELTVAGTLVVYGSCSAQTINVVGDGKILSGNEWRTLNVGSVLNMAGDTIQMTVQLPPGTVMNWDKGMLWGDLNQFGGALLFIRTSGEHLINACTLNLNGVTTWNGNGKIKQVGGTDTHVSIINKGTFLADGSGAFESGGGYLWFTFLNDTMGEFIKDGSGTTTRFATAGAVRPMNFQNRGTLDARAGIFEFTAGTLTLENGSTIKGAGKTRICAGSNLYIPPTSTSTMTGVLELDGGYMEGDGVMTGNGGTFNWISGPLGITQNAYESPRPASLNIPEGMTLNIMGDGDKRLGGTESNCGPCHRQHGVVRNAGTANWTGNGDIVTAWGGGSIVNSGTFIAHNDQEFRPIADGGSFSNTATGILRKETSSGTTAFESGIAFSNSGTTDVRTGIVQANGPMSMLDGSRYTGAGLLVGNAGGKLIGTATVAAGGTVEWRAGLVGGGDPTTPQGTVATEGNGQLNWTGGYLYGTVNVAVGSTLRLNGSGAKSLGYFYSGWDNSVLNLHNAGTILWTGGDIVDVNTGRIHNTGTFSAATSNKLGVNEFNNTGTLLMPVGTVPHVVEVMGPVTNNSPGRFDIEAGELVAKSYFTLNTGSEITGAGRVAMTSDSRLNGTAIITGNGTLEMRDTILRSGTDAAITTTGNGRFEWTGGRITNTLNITEGTRFDILGERAKWIGHYLWWGDNAWGIINNRGIITWTGTGPINDENTGHLNNIGTMRVRTTAEMQGRLTNTGVLDISGGGGLKYGGAWVTFAPEGTVNLELAGNTGLAGRVTYPGTVTQGGILNVTLAPGFQPVIGTAYTVVNQGGGQFSKINLPHEQYFKTAYVSGGATTLTAEVSAQTAAEWRDHHFSGFQGSLSTLMQMDSNGDGFSNLMSRAFGKNPLSQLGQILTLINSLIPPNLATKSVNVGGSEYMAISYQRPGGNSKLLDVNYIPQRSTTLTEASWSSTGVEEYSVTLDPVTSMETVIIRSTVPVGPGKEFLRVKIEAITPP